MMGKSTLACAATAILAAGLGAEEARNVEEFQLPPLRLYLQRHPPRLSWHLGEQLLVAQRPRREQGSLEILTGEGWRPLREIRSLRRLEDGGRSGARGFRADLGFQGGIGAELRVRWGAEGEPRIELTGPPGTIALRDDLLRYPGEHLLGVEGVPWDRPDAPRDPAEDLYERLPGDRFYLSSRGYGVLVEAGGDDPGVPAPRPRRVRPRRGEVKIDAPDPDALRIEAGGRKLAYRILPGPGAGDILQRRRRLGRHTPGGTPNLEIPSGRDGIGRGIRWALALSVLGRLSGDDAGRFLDAMHLSAARVEELGKPGPPSFRPLFLIDPDAPSAWKHADQLFLGDLLLVAPAPEKKGEERKVWFPRGSWEALSPEPGNRSEFQGPGWKEVEAPLDGPSLFRRRK